MPPKPPRPTKPRCMNFSLQTPGPFLPITRTLGIYSLVFSSTSALAIRPNPPSGLGLRFGKDLKIAISPSCKKMTIEISNFGTLDWVIYGTPAPLISTPPSPAMHNTNSQTFTVTGDIVAIKFKSNNESAIKKICLL